MNARELRLLIVLGVILGGGGAAILVYQWFYKPLAEHNTALKKLQRDIDQKQAQLDSTLDDRKLLERARLMSLSPNPNMATSEYENYLGPLLLESGLDIDTFQPSVAAEPKAPPGSGANAVKPGHQVVTFKVRARGELDGLVKTLEVLQKTPLVHRVKTLSIDRADTSAKSTSDKLIIGMIIEALIVNRAEPHADGPLAPDQRLIAMEALLTLHHGPSGLSLMPWVVGPTGPVARQRLAMESGYRHYADLVYKNVFTGPVPPKAVPKEEETTPEPDADIVVTEYIRLDTTDPDGKEAFFRNLVFKTVPIRVKSVPRSGYDTFRVMNELKTKTVVKGKVLRIDQRDLYFQVGEDVYGIHIGQTLSDALRRPLSESEMARLKLTELYDAAWAAEEAKTFEKTAQKKRKGRGG